ncbi:hypothetical protein [Aureitalea marina]|uniref:Adhesin domain-containing protein n=1 Tax=Aureitalea marina TaxID=930804 RepID=A0A2S7KNV0_9FLAO|nr:hypothetical protein [Aureitalea marina]PQB04295.1 hypothetical protein BST85_04815 [Aureitalea marina]
MRRPFNALMLLLMVPAMVLATGGKLKGKYTKEKKLNKEYTVNTNASLTVSNSYGNIDVVSWNENRTVIEVVIKTNGNNEEKVQKKLDDIDVEFSGNASGVSARTVFNGKKKGWNWWGNNNNNVSMEINYTIKVPVTNSVDLSNDYGPINLNRIEGRAEISCDYGQLNIGELMGDNNDLNFDYTKNSTIGYMKTGSINADYSNFTLERTEALDLNADYTKSEVMEVHTLDYSCDYGKLTVGEVTNMDGSGDYIPLRIGKLNGDLTVSADYGSISVDRVTSSGGDINIESDYAGIKIGFESGYSFDFDLDLRYASLKGEELVEMQHTHKENSRKTYKGYHGTKGSGNTIYVNSEYGGVTLKKY